MNKGQGTSTLHFKRSSEIAGEAGYKDAHYFSYLFKRTQSMTPSRISS
ncbi:MAG: AraC family transcriptional regulator [Blautia wexlerae]